MKKIIIALVALFALTVSASAMSYEQARRQALFLTDKMAYELNLTDEQYEAAYEVNLDYLMSINTYDELYGIYWQHRNLELSYILFDWQYRAYCAANYFYRPLYWDAGYWRFRVYARYPHRDYYYFGRPTFYVTYRGSNWRSYNWRDNNVSSRYYNRHFGEGNRTGMRDGFNRGDYGRGVRGIENNRQPTRSFGNGNQNSNSDFNSGRFGGSRSNSSVNRSYENRTRSYGNGSESDYNSNSGRFGGSRSNSSVNRNYENRTRSYGSGSSSDYNSNSGRFGGSRSNSSINRSYENGNMPSRPSSTRSTMPNSSSQGSMSSGRFGGSRNNFSAPNSTFNSNRSSSSREMPSTRSYSPSTSGSRSGGSSVQSSGGGRFGGGSSSSSDNNNGGRFGGRR